MKLKKFNLFEKREGFDDIYEPLDYDDDLYGRPYYSDKDSDDEDDESEDYNEMDEQNDDDMQHLCYLLRQMFYNSGVDEVSVESDGLSVSISVQFNRKEQLRDVLKVFNVVKKIKKDILPQYEDSFEMWETKQGGPVITFDFNLDDGKSSDSTSDDDYPW